MTLARTVRLDLEDGREIQTTYDGRDIRAWEAVSGKSALVEDMTLDQLTWLGHHAAVRRGELNGDLSTYEAFDKVCVSVEGVRETPGPTKARGRAKGSPRSRGADSSAPSPSEPESPSAN